MSTTIDTTKVYFFKNSYTGPGKVLGVQAGTGALKMVDVGSPGYNIHWCIERTSSAPFYKLHPRGKEQQSIDVVNDNGIYSTQLALAATGNYSGQFWRFDLWPANDTPSYPYRLSNNFTGPDKHFDVYSDTLQAFLGTDNHSGQHWALIPA